MKTAKFAGKEIFKMFPTSFKVLLLDNDDGGNDDDDEVLVPVFSLNTLKHCLVQRGLLD